jgi:hypothetical protein
VTNNYCPARCADFVDETRGERFDNIVRQLRAHESAHVIRFDEPGQIDSHSVPSIGLFTIPHEVPPRRGDE